MTVFNLILLLLRRSRPSAEKARIMRDRSVIVAELQLQQRLRRSSIRRSPFRRPTKEKHGRHSPAAWIWNMIRARS